MAHRCVLIILDGLGDRYHPELGGTPLQAAHTPNLDRLASQGANGLFHAAVPGVALSSPDAHLAMYGYGREEQPARSILEALGHGMSFHPDQVVLCARIGSGRPEGDVLIVTDRTPEATSAELAEVIDAVAHFESGGIRFELKGTGGARQVLTLSGAVSHRITDADTHLTNVPLAAVTPPADAADCPRAAGTARALNDYLRWAFRTLDEHPVNRTRVSRGGRALNVLLTYFAGCMKDVQSFPDRWGLRALSISSKPVQWGIAELIGMDTLRPASREDPAEEIAERIKCAVSRISDYDFIHVHTMAPDDAAHTKDPEKKKRVIESLDRGIGEAIAPLIEDPDVLVVVTSDHSTPSSGKLVHSGEPVPVVFLGESVRRDRVTQYNEVDCAMGSLGPVRGKELMLLVLDQLERTMLRELRPTAEPRLFRASTYPPLTIK